jgi:uncharacterized spore protein YtfJ
VAAEAMEASMTTEFKDAMDYEVALEGAQKAAKGSIDGFVERIAERVGGNASVRAVFGEPIERGGITIIPVARVRWAFGGGAGRGPIAMGPGTGTDSSPTQPTINEGLSGMGTGAGGGVTADPIGYLEIGPDGATFKPIASPMPSPGFMLAAGATAALVLRGLARLIRR